MVKYVFLLVIIAAIIDAVVEEGKCTIMCGRLNPKPYTSCVQSGKPERKSCHDPNARPFRYYIQNYCQCDPGSVRQCNGGNKFECVKPENCDMRKPRCTKFFFW